MKTMFRAAIITAVLLTTPGIARAEWFAFPFAGVNTGGKTTRESAAFGASGGWMGHWWGAEGEAAWSPMFFDDDGGFRTKHRASTYTGTFLAGPKIDMWRPYGLFGVGVLRSEIEEVGGLASTTDNRSAMHVGGGISHDMSGHWSLRGDARYIRALKDTEPKGNVFPEKLAKFDFWRIAGGVS